MDDLEEALFAARGFPRRGPLQLPGTLVEQQDLTRLPSTSRRPWEPPRIEKLPAPAERQCPRCQAAANPEAKYCEVCGATVDPTTSRGLTMPTLAIVEEHEIGAGELPTERASAPLSLTFGGYSEQGVHHETLSLDEPKKLRRIVFGAIAIAAIIVLVLVIRLVWSGSSGARRAAQPVSGAPPPENKKKEITNFFPVTFGLETIEKEDQFAGGHAHVIVKLDDQAVFMIRDEGGYASATERANAVADNLRKAAANLQLDRASEFRVVNRPEGQTIIQVMPTLRSEKVLEIVSVTAHDVSGYVRRSNRSLTAAQLAEWWLNRLKDRFNLFVKGEASRLTVADEDGRLLAEISERAEKEATDGRLTRESLNKALQTLSPEQHRLISHEGVRTFPDQKDHQEPRQGHSH